MLAPDRMYIQSTIERIAALRAVHDKKFSDNPAHKNCLPNFDNAIDKLKQELAKVDESTAERTAQSR